MDNQEEEYNFQQSEQAKAEVENQIAEQKVENKVKLEQHLPAGSVARVMLQTLKTQKKGFTAEIVPAMSRYLESQIGSLTLAACNEAEKQGRKKVTIENMKSAAVALGLKIE